MSNSNVKVFFNNSGLPDLTCPRKYALKYVHGLKYVRSDSMLIGSAFHHFMDKIGPGDDLVSLTLNPDKKLPAKFDTSIPSHQQVRLAELALRATALLGTNPGPVMKEKFISVDTTKLVDLSAAASNEAYAQPTYQVLDCMTADRLETMTLGINGEYVVITDYKTTHKQLSKGDLHAGYALQSQLIFYALLLQYAAYTDQLPVEAAPFRDLLIQGRIAARYLFVNYTDKAAEKPATDQIFLQQPTILAEDTLRLFAQLISDKRHLATFLSCNPHLAHPEGRLNGGCWRCPYQSICLLNNPVLEQTAIQQWPLGSSPYDPTHKLEETTE